MIKNAPVPNTLSRKNLLSLEEYSEQRPDFREKMRALKRQRTLHLGDHFTLLFESHETIRYQIQEMLHIEKIFQSAEIQDELDTYNPLIPDGDNLKATLLIEYEDVAVRRQMLQKLKGVEHELWLESEGERITAIADEDLERSDDDKTSAVHFLRYQLNDKLVSAIKFGKPVLVGVNHPDYHLQQTLNEDIIAQLQGDLV